MRNNFMYNICLRIHDILNTWLSRCPWTYNLTTQPEYAEWDSLSATYCGWVDGNQ